MKNPSILFICKANIGRSQIAEVLYNNKVGSNSAISIAGSEARKGKYIVSESKIAKILENSFGISLKNQQVKYLSDLDNSVIAGLHTIVFLYDPISDSKVDGECEIHNLSAYEFFKNNSKNIKILPVTDPYNIEDENINVEIIKSIYAIIDTL